MVSYRRYGRYRGVILAFGWLILCGAQPPKEQPKSGGSAQQTAPAPEPAAPPSPTPSGGPSGNFTAYPGYNPDPCYHAKDHDAADLCAQWRAAIAAEKAAHEARRATNWSIVATFLSALSLAAVAWALKLTVESNQIGRDSLELERNSIVEGNRPWLMNKIIKVGRVEDPGGEYDGGLYFQTTLGNYGNRPAIRLYLRTDLERSKSAEHRPPFPEIDIEDHNGSAPPGHVVLGTHRQITAAEYSAWKAGSLVFWLRVIAAYSEPGVEGRPYQSELIWKLIYSGMTKDQDGEPVPRFIANSSINNVT